MNTKITNVSGVAVTPPSPYALLLGPGESVITADSVDTGPSHTHTGPSHTHTGPSHTHTVQ